jgi:hypothetical protein
MTRARVVNKNGTAVLQLAEGGSKDYRDTTVSEADLQPFYQTRTDEEGGRQVDRRRRDKNEREFRDHERAAGRGNVTSQPRRAFSPPQRLSTPNSHPLGSQRQRAASQPASLPNNFAPQPLLNQQQQPGPPPPLQHPAQHNSGMQSLRIYNSNSNNADQQWSQGADGPTVNNAMFSVNPMQHFMQVQPHFLAFLQQQMYGQKQLSHQQQQQLYTTENGQQLIMRQDSSNNNNRDGF